MGMAPFDLRGEKGQWRAARTALPDTATKQRIRPMTLDEAMRSDGREWKDG
jgi:hypothetical protein